jgi:uncharacterized protein YprB with RNaseH-like and TPR domain
VQFLSRTFQLIKGVGPYRERDLWARDIADWDDFERAAATGTIMSTRLDAELRSKLGEARQALADGDLPALAAMVPPREHWRLYGHFIERAAFFDIEADGDNVPTVVGVMDHQGVATFRRGHSLEQLPARLAQSDVWVSFNGAVYDVPALRAHFGEGFPQPVVHVDLRFLVRQAKLKGGLKGIEKSLGLGRPPHLEGVRGMDAIRLWREWNYNHELEALRILVEYNLYDAINLRSVLEWTAWRIAELNAWSRVEKRPIFERGDVLYDVSRLVMAQP